MFGSVLLFPPLLQQIRGFAPLTTGLILAAGSRFHDLYASGRKAFDKVGARPRLWPE